MRLPVLAVALAALAPAIASATPLVVRASRPVYAEADIARPVVLAREWAEFSLDYRFRDVTRTTDANGHTRAAGYRYRFSWLDLTARYGFTRNLTLFMNVPWAVSTRREGGASRTVESSGMGDVTFGMRWQVFDREHGSSLTSAGLQWDTKQPSGNESAGASGDRNLLLGTGTTNTAVRLFAKQRAGVVALKADAAYVHKFSAVTAWIPDPDAAGYNDRIKPGNEIDAGAHLQIQPVPRAGAEGGLAYIHRDNVRIGHTSSGLNPAAGLPEVPGSSFEALNAEGRLYLEPSVHWTVGAGVAVPLMSRNSGRFFPLEDLSQSWGTTLQATAVFRW